MRPPLDTSPSPLASDEPDGHLLLRRRAAERNAARLSSLSMESASGLVVAAIAGDVPSLAHALPPEHAAAAALAVLPGVVVWAWPRAVSPEEIGRDLASARGALGEDTRAVLVLRPAARVLSSPLQGEVGAEVEGVDAVPLVRAVGGLDEGQLVRGVDVPWSEEAERRISAAGFVTPPPRD